jgi:hypothetical protein
LRSQLETLSIPLSRKKTASARRKCFSVNCVLAEYCLVFAEANIPQPLAHIHDGRSRAHHVAHRLCLQWGPATQPGSSAENSFSLDFGLWSRKLTFRSALLWVYTHLLHGGHACALASVASTMSWAGRWQALVDVAVFGQQRQP